MTSGGGGTRPPRRRPRPRSERAAGGPWPESARSRSASWYARSRCIPPNPNALEARPRSRPSVVEHQARHSSLCSSRSNPTARVGGIELESGQAERREVSRVVDLDQGSRRRVHEVDRKQQALARRVQDRDVALEAGVDRAERSTAAVTGSTSAGSRRAFATRSSPTWPCSHSQSNVWLPSTIPSSAAACAKANEPRHVATGGS